MAALTPFSNSAFDVFSVFSPVLNEKEPLWEWEKSPPKESIHDRRTETAIQKVMKIATEVDAKHRRKISAETKSFTVKKDGQKIAVRIRGEKADTLADELKNAETLKGFDFSGLILDGSDFSNADLQGANFSESDMERVNFTNANLERANLSFANLPHAKLSKANLKHADLKRSYLEGANLLGADLRFADLTQAVLTDTSGYKALISGCKFYDSIGPDGELTKYDLATEIEAYGFAFLNPDKCEQLLIRGLQKEPESASLLKFYAVVQNDIRRNPQKAKELLEQALEIAPDNEDSLISYALFLAFELNDYDEAQKYFDKAIQANVNSPIANLFYAVFFEKIYKNYKEAETLYAKSLENGPNIPDVLLGNASFHSKILHDNKKAERLYKKALDIRPDDATTLSDYSGFLLSQGRLDEVLPYLNKVIKKFNEYTYLPESNKTILTKVHFYLYANGKPETSDDALRELRKMLERGARSRWANFTINIERAKIDGHPAMEWLTKLADVINEKADIDSLADWDDWRNAANLYKSRRYVRKPSDRGHSYGA